MPEPHSPRRPAGAAAAIAVLLGCCLWPATAASATKPADPDQRMLTRVFPSIVRVEAIRLLPYDGHLTKSWSAGSGVIIAPQGYVLTNCHVSEDVDTFRCYLEDGQHVDAKRVGQDPLTDIAVLKMDLTQLKPGTPPLAVAQFGNSDLTKAGEIVYALGSPGFLEQSVTKGIISNPSLVLPERTVGRMLIRDENVGLLVRWIFHDASIFHGNSGGPLVDEQGQVIGVNEIGVFNLSGAIPSNLAHAVALQLIAGGRVIRGWTGLTVQPRLEADGSEVGVEVADVATGSPAEKAGMKPGDVVVAADGTPIAGAQELATTNFYRLEAAKPPGAAYVIDYQRGGVRQQAHLVLVAREAARADDEELSEWGAVMRDLTTAVIREELLPDRSGVMVTNIRPGGPVGQSEPELHPGDVIIAVDGKAVANVAELRAVTHGYFPDSETAELHPSIVSFRRAGAVMQSVVELRNNNPHHIAPTVLKAWLGVASQPLTPKLNHRLGINSEDGGARITRVYAGTDADRAGLKVGDVLLQLDGSPVAERRTEDNQVLERLVRQYKVGTEGTFSVWREGKTVDVPVTFDVQPKPAAEMPLWEDEKLEFEVRDLAFEDRTRLQLDPAVQGVLVFATTPAGWAELGGLHGDDIIAASGTPVADVEQLHRLRDAAVKSGQHWWVLQVRRRGETLFVEINLSHLKP